MFKSRAVFVLARVPKMHGSNEQAGINGTSLTYYAKT